MKLSPSRNLVIDLTANTDFAQVEADDQQVNLTRFSLFFPERRLFFQERSELFDVRCASRTSVAFVEPIEIHDLQIRTLRGSGQNDGVERRAEQKQPCALGAITKREACVLQTTHVPDGESLPDLGLAQGADRAAPRRRRIIRGDHHVNFPRFAGAPSRRWNRQDRGANVIR